MDTFARLSDAPAEWPLSPIRVRDDDGYCPEAEVQHDEAFLATLLLLDREAAERLTALSRLPAHADGSATYS